MVWRVLHVLVAVEEQVEGGEAKSVGLGKSSAAHGGVQVEDAWASVMPHG
jgi:hypothetical protein